MPDFLLRCRHQAVNIRQSIHVTLEISTISASRYVLICVKDLSCQVCLVLITLSFGVWLCLRCQVVYFDAELVDWHVFQSCKVFVNFLRIADRRANLVPLLSTSYIAAILILTGVFLDHGEEAACAFSFDASVVMLVLRRHRCLSQLIFFFKNVSPNRINQLLLLMFLLTISFPLLFDLGVD